MASSSLYLVTSSCAVASDQLQALCRTSQRPQTHLGIVRTVEVDSLRVLSGSSVVTADDKVGGAKVLADDCVPDGLARTSHAHGEGEESEGSHSRGVGADDCLVDANLRAARKR